MPAPAHLVDSLGRCGVSAVVAAFYTFVAVAVVVGVVGPATLTTWPAPVGSAPEVACAPAGDLANCAATQTYMLSGLATYNQLIAVTAAVGRPHAADGTPVAAEDFGYWQTYSLLSEGVDATGARTTLANSNHSVYLDFESNEAGPPPFLIAYYPQCVRAQTRGAARARRLQRGPLSHPPLSLPSSPPSAGSPTPRTL